MSGSGGVAGPRRIEWDGAVQASGAHPWRAGLWAGHGTAVKTRRGQARVSDRRRPGPHRRRCSRRDQGGREWQVLGRVEPFDAGFGAEPRALATGEGGVPLGIERDRRLEIEGAVDDRPGLPVADRREGGQGWVEPLAQSPCLVDEARVELGARPSGDPRPVGVRRHLETEPHDGARVPASGRTRCVTAKLGDLEGAHDPARIPQVHAGRHRRGDRGQSGGEAFDPVALEVVLDPARGPRRRSGAHRCPGLAPRRAGRGPCRRPGSRRRRARPGRAARPPHARRSRRR